MPLRTEGCSWVAWSDITLSHMLLGGCRTFVRISGPRLLCARPPQHNHKQNIFPTSAGKVVVFTTCLQLGSVADRVDRCSRRHHFQGCMV